MFWSEWHDFEHKDTTMPAFGGAQVIQDIVGDIKTRTP